ncbi:MAG TPA: NAD-dependent epimerase/dehydratase family protein [Caldilineaceae bacterium]|nr:NAD-dependent epimerase/dehydratase family protein [Caldilineaceae bacterium]
MTNQQPLDLLLIGGSGFVSGTLARLALARGHRVWAVTRGERPLPAGVHAITADRRDRRAFAAAIGRANQRWQLVVDCIGYEPDDARQDCEVFRACAEHLVFISTDFVYDPARRRFPQPEESAHYLSEGYGGQKRAAERVFVEGNSAAPAWTIVRPGHIYGPGSLLGCLPLHGRDPALLARLQRGEPIALVGGGYFLQQPILAADLAATILSCYGNQRSHGQIYNTAGPEIVESHFYYQIIADLLGVPLQVAEIPVSQFLREQPDRRSFICHRIYDLGKLHEDGLSVPATPLSTGLRQHVTSLMEQANDAH